MPNKISCSGRGGSGRHGGVLSREAGSGTILHGDVIEALGSLGDGSADMIFADPPYNLQLEGELRRPDDSVVDAVNDGWDRFSSFSEYDAFTTSWLTECRRVLRENGSIWVIGTYHNIFRIGKIMQDLGYWILNDVVWVKTNPMPNFRGARFANAHETLIWAKRGKSSGYTFNYWDLKSLNEGLQMRSDWHIPICGGGERIREGGIKAHSTQKPEALLYRVVLSSTRPGDTVLDPFLGTGTTAAVCQTLGRRWIGIEREERYVEVAAGRIESLAERSPPLGGEVLDLYPSRRELKRVPFGALLESGMVRPGEILYSEDGGRKARVNADASVTADGERGSIHRISAMLQGRERSNGWDYWFVKRSGKLLPLDSLRVEYREMASQDVPLNPGTGGKHLSQ